MHYFVEKAATKSRQSGKTVRLSELFVSFALFVTLVACSPVGNGSLPPSSTGEASFPSLAATQPSTGQELPGIASSVAVLDWEAARIVLPLDRYGPTPYEGQILDAAGSIEFARCVYQTDDVAPEVAKEASDYLKMTPEMEHWLYGTWDAPYIARYGYLGIEDPGLTFVRADETVTGECINEVLDVGLSPVMHGNAAAAFEAYDRTMADPRFQGLQTTWRDCVAQAGYALETSYDTAAARMEESWSEEQIQQASLVEATCADDMSYTQQVADINAAYQMEYIRDHEAELVQIKQKADDTLASATQILKDAGVM